MPLSWHAFNKMRKPKIRELIEAIKALIKGPYTSSFPFKPHIPPKKFRGKPEYFDDGCVGCTACVQVCPSKAIDFRDDTKSNPPTRKFELHYDRCNFCGQCQLNCITQEGVKLSNKFDLALFDRKEAVEKVEKELALCEVCGEPAGCKSHLDWLAKKLGPIAFSNPTLFMSRLKELALLDENIVETVKDLTRADRMKILCASCRRKTTLEK